MCCFFFNDTATAEIYTLSLHDALPICFVDLAHLKALEQSGTFKEQKVAIAPIRQAGGAAVEGDPVDRKSTRLNSSHGYISYAVFCLKKKKKNSTTLTPTPTA